MSDERRMKLHRKLLDVLGSDHVYFDPPENVKMVYPCIRYTRRTGDAKYADDIAYHYVQSYDVVYISKNPDDGMVEKMMNSFPRIRYDRHWTAENLHHDNFFIANDK